jgi:hypothetical protein
MLDPLRLFNLEPISFKAIFLPFYLEGAVGCSPMVAAQEKIESNQSITEDRKSEEK